MNNRIKKNYIFNVSYQIFAIIVPIITTPYISRVLSVGGIGIYSFTYAIVKYFMIFAVLGANGYGVREIGKNQDDLKKRSESFWNIFSFKFINSIVMLIIYLIYVSLFAENKLIAYAQGLYLINVMFDISWFYQGIENFKMVTIRNFLIKFLNIFFIFTFIKNEDDLFFYVLGLVIFNILGALSMWINIFKYIEKPNFRKIRPFNNIKTIIQLFFPTIAVQIFSIIDKTMIGIFTTNSIENGYYEQALKIVDMTLTIVTSLSVVMIPSIAKEYNNKNFEIVREKMIKSYKFVFFLATPMMFGIMGISDKLVPIFFGNGYEKIIILLPILSLLYIPMCLNHTSGMQYLVSTGQQKVYSKYLFIGGIVNIIFNMILIPKYFSIGAAIGSILGEIVIMTLCLLFFKKTNQFDFNIFSYGFKYIISGIIMLLYLILLHLIPISYLLFLVIGIIGAILIYILTLIIQKDEMSMEFISIIRKKINIK